MGLRAPRLVRRHRDPYGPGVLGPIDLAIVGAFFAAMVAVGLVFARRHQTASHYFVGARNMGSVGVGLSVVATDVGGGFSIGLGGLGFTMGLSGSWLLFSGLVGAWLAAVLLIPRVRPLADLHGFTTYPDFLEHRFDGRAKTVSAVVSGLAYAAFVGAQVLAGAKLASVAFEIDLGLAVVLMGGVMILYTMLGGIEAVIFTDTIQWIILLVGVAGFAVPIGLDHVGGFEGLAAAVPDGHLSLTNIAPSTFATWLLTILPVWFVANTLYQRIYACADERTAKRAWYIAGLFEWPVLALLATLLGVIARASFPSAEPELALPLVIRDLLPVGATGIVLAAYFAAIMSTADSCLLASVSNVVSDLQARAARRRGRPLDDAALLRRSRVATVIIGTSSIGIALLVPRVLDAVLLSYSFLVSGLFMPTLAALFLPRTTSRQAFASMVIGGGCALLLQVLPALSSIDLGGLDPAWIAIPLSGFALFLPLPDRPRYATDK